jgi:hypothetical protein
MKAYYVCDVCNERFTNFTECDRHETKCREKHATNFRLVNEINQMIKEAHVNGEQIPVSIETPDRPYILVGAEYDAQDQIIILRIKD